MYIRLKKKKKEKGGGGKKKKTEMLVMLAICIMCKKLLYIEKVIVDEDSI